MKKFLIVLAAAVAVMSISIAASAIDVPAVSGPKAGKLGIGYSNSGTPLGGKMWLSDSFGLDVGVGFNSAAAPNFGTEIAVNMIMIKTDPAYLSLRGGMGMSFGAATNLYWPLGINIEYYVAKNVSLNMGLGILLDVNAGAFTISHFTNTTGGLGVYFYL